MAIDLAISVSVGLVGPLTLASSCSASDMAPDTASGSAAVIATSFGLVEWLDD
jgi:hypothetical protein